VPAKVYQCENPKKARPHLELHGVTTLELEELKSMITGPTASSVIEFCELVGGPIFNEATRTGEGNIPRDGNDEGRYLLSPGEGGQRWQAPLSKPKKPVPVDRGDVRVEAGQGEAGEGEGADTAGGSHGGQEEEEAEEGGDGEQEEGEEEEKGGQEEQGGGRMAAAEKRLTRELYERACELLEGIEPLKKLIMQALKDATLKGEKVQKGVALINRPGSPPLRAQLIHTDLSVGRQGFVAIVVLEPCSVLVSPGSHSAVRQYKGLLGSDVQLHKAREADALASVAVPKLLRVQMEPGQVLLLHGNTVHAGDAAVGDRKSPRLHFYVQKGKVDNETNPLFPLGKRFAAKFV
jgi:hypothetical protein